jgi:hypothetical protein
MLEARYKILSFNVVLGLVGGTAAAIMQLLRTSTSWYPNFTYKRSLIRKLYTESVVDDEKSENATDIKNRLSKFKPFVYDLHEAFLMHMINLLTCWQCSKCCLCKCVQKRRERHDKYIKAKERMVEEFDLLNIIKRIRV